MRLLHVSSVPSPLADVAATAVVVVVVLVQFKYRICIIISLENQHCIGCLALMAGIAGMAAARDINKIDSNVFYLFTCVQVPGQTNQ